MGKNAYFQIDIRKDGTYLVLFPAEGDGTVFSFDMLDGYLYQMHLDYDKSAVTGAIAALTEKKEVLLCKNQIPQVDEKLRIEIAKDRLVANAIFFPPSTDGKKLTDKDIAGELIRVGVKHGVDKLLLKQLITKRDYCTYYPLSKATKPVEGKNAEIKYYFNTDLTLKPKMLEDGSVDFHSLDTIASIHEGDLIAELFPAVQGTQGTDVCGNPLLPKKVTTATLRHANRIHLSEDGLKMYSEVNGHANLVEGKVFVSDVYEVAADVDASTGDISSEGNVEVKGNVRTGFKITAKGDIVVNGVVEGAELIADGQIILMRGIQGMSKGKLTAKGNIIAKFIESADVVSTGGYIQADAIMHSNVSAKTEVIVNGKKGFISGGTTKSGQSIVAKTIGSTMGTTTIVEVGVDPTLIEEYRKIEKHIPELAQEKEKCTQMLTLLAKKLKNGEKLTPDKMLALKENKKKVEELDAEMNRLDDRLIELDEVIDMNTNGVVKVTQTVYPGCKVVISGVPYHVKQELSHLRFVKEGADIKIGML